MYENAPAVQFINVNKTCFGVAGLTRDQWIPVSREFEPHREFEPIKGPRCFLEQETLLSLLSTG